MKKKLYTEPGMRVHHIEFYNCVAMSVVDNDNDQAERPDIQSKVWKFMQIDDNVAAAQQAKDEENDF